MKRILWGALGVVVILGLIFGGGDDESNDKAKDDDSTPSKSVSKSQPTTVEEAINAADDVKGEKVDQAGKLTIINFDVSDNVSNNLIRVGIGKDVFALAEELAKLKNLKAKEIGFRGMFPLVDKFGKTKDGQVFFTTFRVSDIRKVDYSEILATTYDNIPNLAIDGIVVVHPDLQD